MKKLFILMIISSLGFVACDNATTEENEQETLEAPNETAAPTQQAPVAPVDTVSNSSDSTASNIRL